MSTSVSARAEMNGMDGEIEFQEKNTNTKSGEITRPPRRWCTCLYPLLLFHCATQGELFSSQFNLFRLKQEWIKLISKLFKSVSRFIHDRVAQCRQIQNPGTTLIHFFLTKPNDFEWIFCWFRLEYNILLWITFFEEQTVT